MYIDSKVITPCSHLQKSGIHHALIEKGGVKHFFKRHYFKINY